MKKRSESTDPRLDNEEAPPLTTEQIREIQRRVRDLHDPVRYMVVSRLLPKWKLWLDVSSDTFCDEIDTGTMFKRVEYARGVLRVLKGERRTKDLTIAKITTKGGKRKVLKYYDGSIST